MRIAALYILVLCLAIYAWRNHFIAICGLILLTAVMQRKEFPTAILGIQGMNPWNMLFAVVVVAWFTMRQVDGRRWDLNGRATGLLICFVLALTITIARGYFAGAHSGPLHGHGALTYFSDHLINPLKFLLLGVMMYDSCRSRRQVYIALLTLVSVFVFWALMTIRFIPFGTLTGDGDFMRYRHRFDREIGLYATDMGMIFAGGFWTILACWAIVKKWRYRVAMLGSAGLVLIGLALTYSRGGYLTLLGVGLLFAMVSWRWLLLGIPIGALVAGVVLPNAANRLATGFSVQNAAGVGVTNMDEVTSGRMTYLWPSAIAEISERPIFGAGRLAILHTPMFDEVTAYTGGSCPNHPHNAYLELLMDAGIVGTLLIAPIYLGILLIGAQLLRAKDDPLARAVGGATLACTGMLVVAGLGSQTFFGTQISTISLWITAALAARMWTERRTAWTLQRRYAATRSVLPRVQANLPVAAP